MFTKQISTTYYVKCATSRDAHMCWSLERPESREIVIKRDIIIAFLSDNEVTYIIIASTFESRISFVTFFCKYVHNTVNDLVDLQMTARKSVLFDKNNRSPYEKSISKCLRNSAILDIVLNN